MPEYPKEPELDFDPLADGDHFAGMPDQDDVIKEITDEIDNGDAHLMTRNELAEFIDWWINLDTDDNANAVIYDEMNNGNASVARHQKIAKEFFVFKEYEKAND